MYKRYNRHILLVTLILSPGTLKSGFGGLKGIQISGTAFEPVHCNE